MARKKKTTGTASKELSEHPDYEQLVTFEQVEAEVTKHKEILVTKDFIERRIKEEKKDYCKALNEQLKEVAEEREHEMGILGALNDRKKQLAAPVLQTPVIPIRAKTS